MKYLPVRASTKPQMQGTYQQGAIHNRFIPGANVAEATASGSGDCAAASEGGSGNNDHLCSTSPAPESETGNPSSAPAAHVNDLGLYIGPDVKLDDNKKLELLTNAWKPSRSYAFPKSDEYGKNRSFAYTWLEKFPWLAYSFHLNGTLCRYCVPLGKHVAIGRNSTKLDRLMTSPITDWTSAL